MSDFDASLSSTHRPKGIRLQKLEVKQLQLQYEDLQLRVDALKELLTEKDSEIKKQRITIKLQEEKINSLTMNSDLLKHRVIILSKHITDVLKETLPVLPPMPEENSKEIDSILATNNKEKKSRRRIKSGSDVLESYKNRPLSDKVPRSQQRNFDFSGSEVLAAISDLHEIRKATQQAARAQGRYTIITSNRISLFEALSLFLSLRNVAFLNKFEIFLPRVLEMLMDLMELERIILYVYEDEQFYSIAQTGEVNKQMVIPKGFSHLYNAIESTLIIPQVYEDSKFDSRYDQISGFKTNNLVCVPLKIADETIGILECANKRSEFIKEDIVLLSQIAKQLALGVIGKLFQDKLKPGTTENSEISEISNSLALPALRSLVFSIKSFLLCEKVSIFKINYDKNQLSCIACTEDTDKLKVDINVSIIGLCYTSKKILNIPNVKENTMYNKKHDTGHKELLVIPLGEQGVLLCANKNKGFSDRDEAKAANQSIVAQNLLQSIEKFERVLVNYEITEEFCKKVHESMVCSDYSGKIVLVNKKAGEIMGVNADSVFGGSFIQLLGQNLEILNVIIANRSLGAFKIPEVVIKGKRMECEILYYERYFILILRS